MHYKFIKYPEAKLDYVMVWATWLGDDTLATSLWTGPDEISLTDGSHTDTQTSIWVEGGQEGESYVLTNEITTVAGRSDKRDIQLFILPFPKRAYCEPTDVADFLGLEFNNAQLIQAARHIDSVTTLIDEHTNRGWQVGEQNGEQHRWPEFRLGNLYLRYTPVASIEEIRGRFTLGVDEVALVDGQDYEVVSLDDGLIRLITPTAYDQVSVDYTPVDVVPAPIRDACAEWVAARMQPMLRDSYGLDSYSLPDLTVKFSRSMMGDGMPTSVKNVLDRYRHWSLA